MASVADLLPCLSTPHNAVPIPPPLPSSIRILTHLQFVAYLFFPELCIAPFLNGYGQKKDKGEKKWKENKANEEHENYK